MNTYVTISKCDKDLIAKTVIANGYEVNFFTVETNENLMRAEINCVDPCMMWYLAKAVGNEEAFAITKKRLNEII